MNKKLKDQETVEVHKDCGGDIKHLGEDGIAYCVNCEHIVEGDTEYVDVDDINYPFEPTYATIE